MYRKKVLSNLMSNVKSESEKVNGTLNTNTRFKWDKVDVYLCKAMVGEELSDVSYLPTDTACNIGDILFQTCKTLKTAAEACSSNRKWYSAKQKLNVWSPQEEIPTTS